jgi:hypothetical protein
MPSAKWLATRGKVSMCLNMDASERFTYYPGSNVRADMPGAHSVTNPVQGFEKF